MEEGLEPRLAAPDAGRGKGQSTAQGDCFWTLAFRTVTE